ncbi:MAG: putative bifunctional diguanylate cyclase/phosphodiesterase [Janthinobacterium lividum]
MRMPSPETAAASPVNLAPQIAPLAHDRGRPELRDELRHALAREQLTVAFQPRVCLTTRRVVGAEALARWPHRRLGMIAPRNFIPVAEQSGLINVLGGWVLRAACCEAARWPDGLCISVNVSARQLADGVVRDQVRDALEESGLAPERLEIELTESMLVDASIETLLTLSSIRDLGVGVALDDFGTGYAGLATIKRLPLTALKLDRMFVRGVLRRNEDTAIARAVISFGIALGLSMVAEGIEWEAQCRFLNALGCHQGQSFLLGRPIPPEQFRQLAESQKLVKGHE